MSCALIAVALILCIQQMGLAADTDALVVTESGNVGIGTPNPGSKLHINSTTDGIFGLWLSRSNVSADHNSWVIWNMDGTYGNDFEIYQYPLDGNPTCFQRFEIQDNGNTILVPQGGNVGIGTTTPEYKLDVAGYVRASGWNGSLSVLGDIRAGNSDIYFTKVDHYHSGIGNTPGHAAIENAANYGALMILGRAGTSNGRYVRLWDYLQVNGSMDITGNVGIGTAAPQYKLDVAGAIRADQLILPQPIYPEYVFEEDYDLKPLEEVEAYIREHKHLPDIPPAKQVMEQGLSVSDMMVKQMQKIEELTLYMIDLKKSNESLVKENKRLSEASELAKQANKKFEERLARLETTLAIK